MPIVKTVKGDLLKMFREGHFNEIVHGCNCFHNMGAGIAAQIAREFPDALAADKAGFDYGDKSKLGDYTVVGTQYGLIINMYTQYNLGRVRNKKSLYDTIRIGFQRLDKDGDINDGWKIGIPLIGAGIAGGDWDTIKGIINEATPNSQIIVVEYAPG
jgi:O-acetyl-ADP-ribose deacetylase (regulator of RNase III)